MEANRVKYPDRMTKLLHDFRKVRKVSLAFQQEFVEPVASETFKRLLKFCLKEKFFRTVYYQIQKAEGLVRAD